MIHPIPHIQQWLSMPDVLPKTVLPPPLRKALGRPRTNSKREVDKGVPFSQTKRSTTFKCSNCKAFGHNRRTCQGAPVNAKNGSSTSRNQVKSEQYLYRLP